MKYFGNADSVSVQPPTRGALWHTSKLIKRTRPDDIKFRPEVSATW